MSSALTELRLPASVSQDLELRLLWARAASLPFQCNRSKTAIVCEVSLSTLTRGSVESLVMNVRQERHSAWK